MFSIFISLIDYLAFLETRNWHAKNRWFLNHRWLAICLRFLPSIAAISINRNWRSSGTSIFTLIKTASVLSFLLAFSLTLLSIFSRLKGNRLIYLIRGNLYANKNYYRFNCEYHS